MTTLTESQQYILNMRKLTFFVNKLKEDYENLSQITVFGHNAKETSFDNKPPGWNIEIFKIILVLGDEKKALKTSELWELFKNRPQLKFGKNNSNRKIEKNCFVQINIGTKLNRTKIDDKEIEYYSSTGFSIKGKKEKDVMGNMLDSFNKITSEKSLSSTYSWFNDEEDTSNIIEVNINEIEGLCEDDD